MFNTPNRRTTKNRGMNKRFASVCTGVGLFELAATWAGYQCAFTSEIKPYCKRLLAKRFPQTIHYGDFTTKSFRAHARINYRWHINVLAAGLPCQPFSVAGLKKGQMDERHLGPAFVELVASIRPAWVIVENVAGFVKMAFDDFKSAMEAKGYTCTAFVLPACAVGAPHRRDRVWIICYSAADADRINWGRQRQHPRSCGPGARHQFGRRLADLTNAYCFRFKIARFRQPVSKSKRNRKNAARHDKNPNGSTDGGVQTAWREWELRNVGAADEVWNAANPIGSRTGSPAENIRTWQYQSRSDTGNAYRINGDVSGYGAGPVSFDQTPPVSGFDSHSNGKRQQQPEGAVGNESGRIGDSDQRHPADAGRAGLQGGQQSGTFVEGSGASRPVAERAGFSGWDEHWYEVAARICRVDDGDAAGVDRLGSGSRFVEYRPSGRYRTLRLEAGGNGLVAHIPYEILRFIDSL